MSKDKVNLTIWFSHFYLSGEKYLCLYSALPSNHIFHNLVIVFMKIYTKKNLCCMYLFPILILNIRDNRRRHIMTIIVVEEDIKELFILGTTRELIGRNRSMHYILHYISNIIFQLITRHFFHVGPLLSDRHKSHCITAAHSRADEDEQSSSAAAGWSSSQLRAHSSLSCLGRFYFRFETVNIISISRAEQMRKAKPLQCMSK